MRIYYFDCFDSRGPHLDTVGMVLSNASEAAEQATGVLSHMLAEHTDTLGSHEVTILVRSDQGKPIYIAHGAMQGHIIPDAST